MKNKTQTTTAKTILFVLFIFFSGSKMFAQDITFNVLTYKGSSNISCHGLSDGAIDATIVNGVAPYVYAWTGPNNFSATTEDITGVPAGSYTLSVTDANNHQASKSVTLYESDALTLTLTPSKYNGSFNISRTGGSDGTISTDVGGGATPYSYQWSNSSTATGAAMSGLTAGSYTVTVTDQNGCTVNQSQTMTEPTALHIVSVSASN